MGDFRNTTLGTGLLTIGGVDAGFLKGDVKVSRKVDQAVFESGVPLQPQGRVNTKQTIELTAPLGELTVPNLAAVSGTIPVTSNAGTPVVVAMGQAKTFAVPVLGGLEYILLDGEVVTALTVKDSTEVTTYTAGTDYLLDAARGVVYRNPAGTITTLQVVHVGYTYTTPASKQIDLGKYFVFIETDILFTHVSPVSGKTWTVKFWRAQGSAEIDLNFQETNYTITNVTFLSLPDATAHPTNPNGYMRRTN